MHTFTNVVTSLFPRYIGATAKYCDQCVCLSVCLSAGVSQKPQAIFHCNFTYVTCDRGSVLLWRQCDMLSTFQFCGWRHISYNSAYGQHQRRRVYFIEFVRWRHRDEVCHLRLHLIVALWIWNNVQMKSKENGTKSRSENRNNQKSRFFFKVKIVSLEGHLSLSRVMRVGGGGRQKQ